MKKLLLIDGNSLLHRAYHALPPLTDRHGEMANAVFGFSNMILKAIGEIKPTHIACAFDTAAPTFRHIEFEKYKAQRKAPPPDLYPQLPKVKKVLDAFGIPYFEKEGYEADDLLATLTVKSLSNVIAIRRKPEKQSQTKGKKIASSRTPRNDRVDQVIILSGDRDVLQLVDGNIKVQMPGWNLNQTSLYGAAEVREKFALEPHQMVDYKSLIGDLSDNIPGIAGIGPVTAASLLHKFHTLEELFAQLERNPGSLGNVAEKLKAGRDVAVAAKRLVELDRNVDIEFKVGDLNFNPDWEKVRREYEDLGFKSIVSKLPGMNKEEVSKVSNVSNNNNEDQLKLI